MQISTCKFTYNKQHRGFVAEASDLCPVSQPLFHRVFDDSCDDGITLISHITGLSADFYVDEIGKNADQDILYWLLKPTSTTVRKYPRLRGVYVRIFND